MLSEMFRVEDRDELRTDARDELRDELRDDKREDDVGTGIKSSVILT